MSKIPALSIWFACCVALGLLLAYADGIDLASLAKAALLMFTIGLIALVLRAIYLLTFAERK